MNRKTYRKIAKQHGVSVAEVKRDMQEAITAAYADPNTDFATFKAQRAVPHKGDVPTPDEEIDYAVAEIRRREKEK